MVLPLEPTDVPGVYRRGSKFVVVYRAGGRQRKQSADTMIDARAIKLQRDGEARALRRGPTLHEFSLSWLDRYAGTGHDSVRANTRVEYRRLLVNFALSYFDREVRVGEMDRAGVQQFVDWLTTRPGRDGRLCDRSISNALTPLRLALDAAVAEGLLDANPAEHVVLPRRRAGRAWSTRERRFLTRAELVRLLDEIPPKWGPLFELLAATGLRISEAIGLRWSDLVLDGPAPHLQVRRAIVKGAAVAPKSRHGARLIPLTPELAATLRAHRPRNAVEDAFVFPGRDGGASDQGSPAPPRAHPRRRTRGTDRCRLSHPPSHVRVDADRVRSKPAAPAALDGPPLARVHARDLRAPDRRRPRTRTRLPQRAAPCPAMIKAARRGGRPRTASRVPPARGHSPPATSDARSSSRASAGTGSPETTASTGSTSAPVDRPHPCAPLSCMEGSANELTAASADAGARRAGIARRCTTPNRPGASI
jgi:integrase